MNSPLKNHPFAVEAFFECSVVLTYAVPKDQLKTYSRMLRVGYI
jgi:hypothetical protein